MALLGIASDWLPRPHYGGRSLSAEKLDRLFVVPKLDLAPENLAQAVRALIPNRHKISFAAQLEHLPETAGDLGFEPSFPASTSQGKDTRLTLENHLSQVFKIRHAPVCIVVALG
jgi:hypothetical protein